MTSTDERLLDLTHAVYDQTIALARIGDLLEYQLIQGSNLARKILRETELRNRLWPQQET